MKTTSLSVLALGTCASVAFAEPASTVADAKEGAMAAAHAAGPVALTEAEMDKVTAGGELMWGNFTKVDIYTSTNRHAGEIDVLSWSWGTSQQSR